MLLPIRQNRVVSSENDIKNIRLTVSGKAYVKYRSNSQICSCFFRIGYHSSIYPFSAVPPYISKDGPSTCS